MQYGRAKRISSIINSNQGGGSKKAGLPFMVGRITNTSIAIDQSGSDGILKFALLPVSTRSFNNGIGHISGYRYNRR